MAFLFLVRNVRVLGSKAHLAQGHLVEERLKQANSQVGMRSGRKAFAYPPPPRLRLFHWSLIPRGPASHLLVHLLSGLSTLFMIPSFGEELFPVHD